MFSPQAYGSVNPAGIFLGLKVSFDSKYDKHIIVRKTTMNTASGESSKFAPIYF
jgi:hypothetical protein